MTWAAPAWLFGLAAPAAVALALLLYGLLRRRESGPRWPRVTRVLASASGFAPVPAQKVMRRPWLLLMSASCCIVALARPQWGEVEESVTEQAREVMIALDLSRSMLVDDVAPNRMDRSRLLVRSLLDGLRGERVGMIVFAGTAFVQVPLSADYEILKEFLPELNPDYMPQGGTDYEGMLRAALESFGEAAEADRFLVILSDGESTTEGWRNYLKELQERNVRVIALGIGTSAGGFVPDPKSGYAKDERGAVVLSRLESATLQELAATTHGAYRDASVWVDLPALLEETVALGKLRNFEEQRRTRRLERFQWFLAPAVLLALAGIWREFAVKPAVRAVRVETSGRRAAHTATTTAACILAWLASPDWTVAAAGNEPPPAEQAIRDTITRLVATPRPTAADWRGLAEQTIAFGEQTTASQQPVSPGPIIDALAAVDEGEQINPTATDWPALRQKLEALLTPPPPQNQEQQQSQEPEQQEDEPQDQQKQQDQSQPENGQDSPDQNNQQQSNSQQSNEPQPNEPSPGKNPESGQSQDGSQNQPPNQNAADDQSSTSEPQSPPPAGGEMGDLASPEENEKTPRPNPGEPRPSDGEKKKIGGRRASNPVSEDLDPQQAAALQELRQVQDRDAPARLFELLEGDAASSQPGPNW